MYIQKLRLGGGFSQTLLEQRPGFASILFEGKGSRNTFESEGGGHRVQRVSPTEKRGRVHTSTITVATLNPNTPSYKLDEKDVEIQTKRGSGPGGQHRNKTDSCVVVTHKPTKISVTIDARSQHQNKALALRILSERVGEIQQRKHKNKQDQIRRNQVGTGMRADKRRTYRSQDDSVKDHITGQTWRLSDWMKGYW